MSAEKESTPIMSLLGRLGKTVFAMLAAVSIFAAPQSQPALQISSPANGSTINPGHTLSVTVTSPAGIAFQMVALIGPDPIGFNTSGTSIPAQFSIAIPPDADCHVYTLTADGLTQSGQSVSSAPIQIDIERPDFPLALSTSDSSLNLESQGEQTHLIVLAGFLDGSQIDVTHSTLVSYVSSNPAIATVDSSGTVTAVAAGSASITVIYTLVSQNLQIPVPVTVQQPMLSTSPSSLTFTGLAWRDRAEFPCRCLL
jgi:Big-like domain-containing protein